MAIPVVLSRALHPTNSTVPVKPGLPVRAQPVPVPLFSPRQAMNREPAPLVICHPPVALPVASQPINHESASADTLTPHPLQAENLHPHSCQKSGGTKSGLAGAACRPSPVTFHTSTSRSLTP